MGMEGYFFAVAVNSSLTASEIKDFIEHQFEVHPYLMPSGKLFKRHIVDESRFTIDNKAVAGIATLENVAKITFELCFSNYDRNVTYIFNVSKKISSLGSVSSLIVLNSQYDFNVMEFEEFRRVLKQSHKDKLNNFNEKYGKLNIDILPQDFYNCVRRLKVKH